MWFVSWAHIGAQPRAARGSTAAAVPQERGEALPSQRDGVLGESEERRRAQRAEHRTGPQSIRRGRDSNPRYLLGTHALQACPFGRSGTSPRAATLAEACSRRKRRDGVRTHRRMC